MSFPPGTEMFQFPGFAPPHYGFMRRYPCGWVAPFGYPRIEACSRLPVAFRSVPRPSSPPSAKASTECPSHARPPCTETGAGYTDTDPVRSIEQILNSLYTAHNSILGTPHGSCGPKMSNDRLRPLAARPRNTVLRARTFGQTDGQAAGIWTTFRLHPLARPETHQNPIYPDKEQRTVRRPRKRHRYPLPGTSKTEFLACRDISGR